MASKDLAQDLPWWENALVVGIDQNHRSGFGYQRPELQYCILPVRIRGTDDPGRDSLSGAVNPDSCDPEPVSLSVCVSVCVCG